MNTNTDTFKPKFNKRKSLHIYNCCGLFPVVIIPWLSAPLGFLWERRILHLTRQELNLLKYLGPIWGSQPWLHINITWEKFKVFQCPVHMSDFGSNASSALI